MSERTAIGRSDLLRMKTTLQELVTAVENLVSWAEQRAVTKQDLSEALGAPPPEQLETDDKGARTPEDLAKELIYAGFGGLADLGTELLGCLFAEVHAEARLRGLLDDAGQMRYVPSSASGLKPQWVFDALRERQGNNDENTAA